MCNETLDRIISKGECEYHLKVRRAVKALDDVRLYAKLAKKCT